MPVTKIAKESSCANRKPNSSCRGGAEELPTNGHWAVQRTCTPYVVVLRNLVHGNGLTHAIEPTT